MALTISERKQISNRYAQAAYVLAAEKNEAAQAAEAMLSLKALFEQGGDLIRAMHNPLLDTAALGRAFHALLEKLQAPDIMYQLLRTVIANGRISLLPEIADAFMSAHYEANGIRQIEITSAAPLSDTQMQTIKAALASGKEEMLIHNRVDPHIIGGLRIRKGSHMLDASVSGALGRMATRLTATNSY